MTHQRATPWKASGAAVPQQADLAAARGAAGKSSLVTAALAKPLRHHRQSTQDFRYTTNIVVSIFIIARKMF